MPTVTTNGIQTYYEARGDGPPILFVHGAGNDHNYWTHQLDALEDDYRVVAYDLRDHGQTDASSHEYRVELLAEDLQALIDALELEAPNICGLSLGGFVAQQHAVEYPEVAAGYVFADTYTPATYSIGEYGIRYLLPRTMEALIKRIGWETPQALVQQLEKVIVDDPEPAESAEPDMVREATVELSDAEAKRMAHVGVSWLQSNIDLTGISQPVLCLYGERELDYIASHVGRMATAIDDFEAVELPDAGHQAQIDNPNAFTDSLESFLAEHAVE